MLQSLDKQTDKWHYRKSSVEIYQLNKVPIILNEEFVRWKLNKGIIVSL